MPPVDFNGGQLKLQSTERDGGGGNALAAQLALLLILRKLYESDGVCITTMPICGLHWCQQ